MTRLWWWCAACTCKCKVLLVTRVCTLCLASLECQSALDPWCCVDQSTTYGARYYYYYYYHHYYYYYNYYYYYFYYYYYYYYLWIYIYIYIYIYTIIYVIIYVARFETYIRLFMTSVRIRRISKSSHKLFLENVFYHTLIDDLFRAHSASVDGLMQSVEFSIEVSQLVHSHRLI